MRSTQLDTKELAQLGFERGDMTQDELFRVGEILVGHGRTQDEIREVFRLAERELALGYLERLKAQLI
jgi:hypothetical protein